MSWKEKVDSGKNQDEAPVVLTPEEVEAAEVELAEKRRAEDEAAQALARRVENKMMERGLTTTFRESHRRKDEIIIKFSCTDIHPWLPLLDLEGQIIILGFRKAVVGQGELNFNKTPEEGDEAGADLVGASPTTDGPMPEMPESLKEKIRSGEIEIS